MLTTRNNRTAGNNYEREIVIEINDLGYKVGSARLHSRYYDNMKVDIVDVPPVENPFPLHIQCKTSANRVNYPKFFEEFTLKDKPFAVFHKFTKKAKKNFMAQGEYVILKKEDFYEILKRLNGK